MGTKSFNLVCSTIHGNTVFVEDPKLYAYRNAAMLYTIEGVQGKVTANEDKTFTVASLANNKMTFAPRLEEGKRMCAGNPESASKAWEKHILSHGGVPFTLKNPDGSVTVNDFSGKVKNITYLKKGSEA
jgi:hypothetical protein